MVVGIENHLYLTMHLGVKAMLVLERFGALHPFTDKEAERKGKAVVQKIIIMAGGDHFTRGIIYVHRI